jgi:fructuronate reductase
MELSGSDRARLDLGSLARVPPECRPRVRPDALRPGIVHIGLGAFHRAHQAVFTEDAMAASGDLSWGIVAVAPRSPDVYERLRQQDGLFSVTSLDGAGASTRVVGSIAGLCHAAADPAALPLLVADGAVRIVTLTVTEKAYAWDSAAGRLREDPDVVADLASDRPPRTVPGMLVRALVARARADAGPLAVLSCDNLTANGRMLAAVVGDGLARAVGVTESDRAWLAANVSFPSCMVDRIVPAQTDDTVAQASAALGVLDRAALAAEPYKQWVVEDLFPGGRPAWERGGVVLTGDVTPYEHLKLRTLNGVHTALALLGALAGAETIAEALALPHAADAMRGLIADDVAPSLSPPDGVDVVHYGSSVLSRFANPAIGHRTLQVAMDCSQKLPQRVLSTILARRAEGGVPRRSALVLAAWMRFLQGSADDGRPLPLDDPMAAQLRAALAASDSTPAGIVDAVLRLDSVFPPEIAKDDEVRVLIAEWLEALTRYGALAALAAAA